MWRRPEQMAAHAALDLAHRQGLPNGEELERQHLLAAAWELGPLAGERVRVGWRGRRLSPATQRASGKIHLEAIGPHGPLSSIPTAVRHGEPYRQARAAQREALKYYRLFKRHLRFLCWKRDR